MVVSDSLGAPATVSGARGLSQQMAVCRGDELGLLVSHFPPGFVFPSHPLGGSSESASAGRCRVSPWLGSAPGPHGSHAQGLVLCCGARVLLAEVVWAGSACWALGFVFVCLLPHTSSLVLCAVVLFERC